MAQNAIHVKQDNIHSVLWSLHSCKSASSKTLSQMTGLSFATVNNILNALVKTGEALPGQTLPSSGGRPSQTYLFNANFAHLLMLSVGVQAGAHSAQACVCNLNGETVLKIERYFDDINLSSIECVIDACLSKDPTIRVLVLSLPGAAFNGSVLTNDYPALEALPITRHLEEKYQRLSLLENDVNAAVLGFSQRIKQPSTTAGIYFPKCFNPGAAFVIDGKILTGAGGFAGEVGLIPLEVEWTTLDYDNPFEISAAIVKLIGIICCVLNPHHIVLYGDFFSDAVRAALCTASQTQDLCRIFPPLTCKQDLNSDMMRGLFAQAISAYRNETARCLL